MDQHRRDTQHLPSNWSPFTLQRAVPILVPHTTIPWQSPQESFPSPCTPWFSNPTGH